MFRADIVAGNEDRLTADGSRVVSLPKTTGTGAKNLPFDIVGQTLVLDNFEYRITRRHNAREFVVDEPIAAGTYAVWTIKYLKYPMPRDTVEVLGIMDRGFKNTEKISFSVTTGSLSQGDLETTTDTTTSTTTGPDRGRFIFLDARKEEYLYLDRVDTGDPFVSIEEMHANIQPPDYGPALKTGILPGDSTDLKAHPIKDATYQYCYTFEYAGMESAPSPISEIDLREEGPGGLPGYIANIKISKLMDTQAHRLVNAGLSGITGRVKKIYRRVSVEPTSLDLKKDISLRQGMGPWRHIATLKESETTYTDDCDELTTDTVIDDTPSSTFTNIDSSGDPFKVARLNEIGPRQYLRFWYTPESDYKVEVRYHRRPFRLVNDSDTPEWPVQYHHYLVYAALKDICMQHGMLQNSELYDGRANQLMERMKSKYLSRTDRMYVRRGFDRAMADRERWGIPSKS